MGLGHVKTLSLISKTECMIRCAGRPPQLHQKSYGFFFQNSKWKTKAACLQWTWASVLKENITKKWSAIPINGSNTYDLRSYKNMHRWTEKTLTGHGSIGVEQFFKPNETWCATLKIKSYKGKKSSINKFTAIRTLWSLQIQFSPARKGTKFYHILNVS